MAGPLGLLVAGARLLAGGAARAAATAAPAAARGGAAVAKAAAQSGAAPNILVDGKGNTVHVHTAPPQGAPHKEAALDKAWKIDSAVSLFERLLDKMSSLTATAIHTIQVTAVGGPNADLRRVWYLCVAAAFGRYRNRVGATGAVEYQIECAWDVTGKTTMVTLGYTLSGLTGNVGRDVVTPAAGALTVFGAALVGGRVAGEWVRREGKAAPPGGSSTGAVRTVSGGAAGVVDLIQRGPDQVTVGAAWPTFLRRVPVVGGSSGVAERNRGRYDPAFDGRSTLVALGEYVRTRFGGAGGPDRPNVLRELPWSTNLGSQPAIAVPVGAVADLFRDRNYHKRFEGQTGPYSWILSAGIGAPLLPDAGRVITTGEKYDPDVQPPRPQTDGLSRGSLVELVTLALEDPCKAPIKVAPDDTVVAPKGVRIHAPDAEFRGEVRRVPLTDGEALAVDIGAAILTGAVVDDEDGRTIPAVNEEAE